MLLSIKRLFVFVLLGVLLSCILARPTFAQSKIPILKINQYYIPFLSPRGPYIDNKDKIIVPVRAFCHAVGIQLVEQDGVLKLSLNETHLTIPKRTQFISIATLIKSFDFNYRWESVQKRLVVDDRRLMGTPQIVITSNTTNLQEYARPLDSAEEIAVLGIVQRTLREAVTGLPLGEVKITVKNLSDKGMMEGKFCPILMSVSKEGINFAGAILPGTPDNPYHPYPAIESGKSFVFATRYSIDPKSPTEYMIFFPGIRRSKANAKEKRQGFILPLLQPNSSFADNFHTFAAGFCWR